MLADLQWKDIPEDISYQLRDLAERYSDENTYHIIIVGDRKTGKTTYIDNISKSKFQHLPTVFMGVELSLALIGKSLIHLWKVDSDPEIISILKKNIFYLDGVIGFFDLTDEETFLNMQARVSELILKYGKMFPFIMVGNKADLPGREISQENVLVFAYELGNCSCHRIPYAEMSAVSNIGIEQVVNNLITMINCNLTSKCSSHPALLRQWCNVPQFYSFIKEPRQKLNVV